MSKAAHLLQPTKEFHQLPYDELERMAIEQNLGTLCSQGALVVSTGKFTGRSPDDRFIVEDNETRDEVWWDGKINKPISEDNYHNIKEAMYQYAKDKTFYSYDVFAGAHPDYRKKIRVFMEKPWSGIFVQNMFIVPTKEEFENFGTPDWVVWDMPGFTMDNPETHGLRQKNFTILSFDEQFALVGGSGYTGEIKKGIFSALNFLLPRKNVLPMHCSANVGEDGDTALFFGLSGTGKTTLSADPNRALIGDDEHGWTPDNKIYNFEGGCYAKVIDITAESEPDIYRAIKKGALLENVVFKEGTNEVDYTDYSVTKNTRVSYPLSHIDNVQPGSIGENPTNVFFLTFDAYGALPPIAKLTPEQAAYHFISGYTSKVAGTEAGVDEPQTVFSACFGAPFMPRHPGEYGDMLSKKIEENKVNVWLINTGLDGHKKRMTLKHTRGVITAALRGDLDNVKYEKIPVFDIAIPLSCPNVPEEVLHPESKWESKEAWVVGLKKLATAFEKNFEKYRDHTPQEVLDAAPHID